MELNKNNKEKDLSKIKCNNMQGITLIALVVTIIVLIILAGVSINLVLGENGIITKAKEAKTETEQAILNEEVALNEVAEYLDNMGIGNSPTEKSEIEKYRDSGTYMTEKTTLKDSNGNLIKVPEGFKIAEDSGINVTEGIVIEDNDIIEGIGNNRGNQYVWIPVGTEIKKADGTTKNITLGRYIFADGTNHKDTDGNTLAKGTPILKQNAENYAAEIEINIKEMVPTHQYNIGFKELSTSRTGVLSSGSNGLNTTALNLKGFIDSVKENGGYYIARYEASYGTDGKVNSKVSNTFTDSDTAPTTRTEGMLWNYITQIDAATASRVLYTTATTDLINSYAWDTAIVYIQEFSGDTDYSRQISKNASLANTGINEDEVCKINDMASNTMEWTTEYSTFIDGSRAIPCTCLGGLYNGTYYTCGRGVTDTVFALKYNTFRATLYM